MPDPPISGELKAAIAAAKIAVLSRYDARMKEAMKIKNPVERAAALRAIKDQRKAEIAMLAQQAVRDIYERQQTRRQQKKSRARHP